MRERRCFVRVPVGAEVSYHLEGETFSPHLGMSEDISQDGMRISQPEPLEKGKEVSVLFSLPAGGRIDIVGRVIWCSKWSGPGQRLYHAGLRWMQISPSARSRLNAFLIDRIEPGTPIMGLGTSPFIIPSIEPPIELNIEPPEAPQALPPAEPLTGSQIIHWGAIVLAMLAVALLGALIGFWIYPR